MNKTINSNELDYTVCDISIIGAGISGVYSGYRILDSDKTKRVIIIEKNEEVGGRLKSAFFDTVSNFPVEHGGMRFSKKHLIVKTLTKKFGLETKKFDYKLVGYVLREKRCLCTTLTDDIKDIYKLRDYEQNKTPQQLIEYAIQENFNLTDFVDLDEKEKIKIIKNLLKENRFQNRPLNSISWEGFLRMILTAEAVEFIKATEGYNSNVDNMPASEGLKELNRFSEEYHYIVKGYQNLVKTMAEKFIELGGQILYGSKVVKFKKHNGKTFDSKVKQIFKQFKDKGETIPPYYVKIRHENHHEEYIFCNKIILSIPKTAIKKLDQFTEFFDFENGGMAENMLDKVQEMKSLKIYIKFHYAWWEDYGLSNSKIYTDGLIRMAYFLGNGVDKKNQDPSLMLIYVDQSAAQRMVIPGNYKPTDKILDEQYGLITQTLRAHIQDLIRIFKSSERVDIPPIFNLAYTYWEEAYHCYIPHADVNETIEKIIHPVEDHSVFICGSTYSSKQSWAEGALLTSEYMLQKHFDILPLEKLPKGYARIGLFEH